MNYKQIRLLRKILSPFILFYLTGFVGIIHFKEIINELHKRAKYEDRNNVWFAKRCFFVYFQTFFLTILNIVSIIMTFYFILK